jgi:hypothetical protein
MATNVVAFPAQTNCPTCGRACSDEDLSECLRCGQQYCSRDSWECECDREAAEVIDRGTRPMVPALSRFLSGLFGAAGSK